MSPRKLRNRQLINQFVTVRSKAKRHSFINLDTSLPRKDANAKNQKANQKNVSILNDSQLQFSKKKTSSIRSKTNNISIRNSLTRSYNRKVTEDMHDNSILDISNMSHELLQEIPVKLKSTPVCNSKKTQFEKSPEQLSVTFNKKSRKSNAYNKLPEQVVTPKSSPISVTLTPFRTTKTPKRSPLNLRSSKSHPRGSFRLSRTPRKLMLLNNSTSTWGSPNTSLELRKNIGKKIQNTSLNNMKMSNANAKSKKLKKIRTSIEQLKFTPQKLSKSPKIILKSPKLKSNSPKLGTKNVEDFSTSKLRSSNKNDSTKVTTISNKNNIDHKSLSSEESNLDLTLTNNLSTQYKNIMSRKPIVILEKNSLLDSLGESLKIQGNQCNILKKSIILNNLWNEENKELNKTNIVASSTPNIQLKKCLDNSISFHSPEGKSSPVINKKIYNKSPSTPVSNLFKTTSILVESNIENATYNKNTTNDGQNNTMIIENNKTVIADETYELFEPKTPNLQLISRKRILSEDETDKEDVKKVRFDTNEDHIKKVQTNSNTSIRKTPLAKYIPQKRSSTVSTPFTNKNVSHLQVRRSNSIPNVNTTPYKNIKTKQKTPSSTLDKIKHSKRQKDIKVYSEKRKIPNFAEIHKQMFAKMESLVDNKQRVKKQHEALKETPKIIKPGKKSPTKLISPGTKNMYTKFGFKIRKTDATNIILRKDQQNVQKQKREEAKAFLKGVRTNRRFELQMKMRKASK